MRIAVDAMGGDFAPEAIVEGTIQAAEEFGFHLILVGQEERVHEELAKYQTDHLSIEVQHASEVVDMHDLPSFALRRKKGSSLHLAIDMVKQGEVDAAISAGNTGAAMAIGKLACRMLDGIDRPALATILPNMSGLTVLIDVGANVDCKPLHLLQFAVMGHAYAKEVYGIAEPRIGLLSIGEEESKGNILTKEVFEPLSHGPLHFIGNAEGRDVFNGRVDVVVCDGFIGNVVLKVSESLAKNIGKLLKEGFTRNWRTKLGYLLVKPEMEAMKRRVDYQEYGGAPLLGLNGVVIVSHGSSKARAIKNAIRVAAESVNQHLNEHIVETIRDCEFDIKSRAKATSLWTQLKRSITPDSDKDKKRADNKHRAEKPDKKEEADTVLPPEEAPSEESADSPKEPEQEKKPWWHLTHRDEPEKEEEQAAESEKEEKTATTSLQEDEQAHPEPSDQASRAAPPEEPKPHKRPWWHLTHRDAEKDDKEENSAEESREREDAEHQPEEQEEEHAEAAGDEQEQPKDPKPEKKHWWQLSRKDSAEETPAEEQEQKTEEAETSAQDESEEESSALSASHEWQPDSEEHTEDEHSTSSAAPTS